MKLECKNMHGETIVIPNTISPRPTSSNIPKPSSGHISNPSTTSSTKATTATTTTSTKRKVPEYDELDPEFVTFSVIENGVMKQSSCHKALAIHYSQFFRSTFQPPKRATTLFNTTHNAFSIVLRFFYTEKVRDRSDKMPPATELIEAYFLADRLGVPKLQNLILEGIEHHQRRDGIVQTRMIPRIYSETRAGSPLRRLVAHHVARLRLKDLLAASEARPQYYPPALLIDVISVLKKYGSMLAEPVMTEFMVPVPDT